MRQDGGPAGSDKSLSQEDIEIAESVVDSAGGLKTGSFLDEVFGEVGLLAKFEGLASVVEAELPLRVDGEHGAAAFSGAVLAASRVIDGAVVLVGLVGMGFHLVSSDRGAHPPGIFVNADDKGVAGRRRVNADAKGVTGKQEVCRERIRRNVLERLELRFHTEW